MTTESQRKAQSVLDKVLGREPSFGNRDSSAYYYKHGVYGVNIRVLKMDSYELDAVLRSKPNGRMYSSFDRLGSRAKLPRPFYYLFKYIVGCTGMVKFLHHATLVEALKTWERLGNGPAPRSVYPSNIFVAEEIHLPAFSPSNVAWLIRFWSHARSTQLGPRFAVFYTSGGSTEYLPITTERPGPFPNSRADNAKEEMELMNNYEGDDYDPCEVRGNADRNEMVSLLQQAKGVQFVDCTVPSTSPKSKRSGTVYTYKAFEVEVKPGDHVLAQFGDGHKVMTVAKILPEAPSPNEYDYSIPMKHIVSKVDLARSKALSEMDRGLLKRITSSEAQDRLERLQRQLGLSVADIELKLEPPQDDDDVVGTSE